MFPPKSPQAHPLETPLELGAVRCDAVWHVQLYTARLLLAGPECVWKTPEHNYFSVSAFSAADWLIVLQQCSGKIRVQARPRSQKSRQNSVSTPTPGLDKPVLVRDAHDSKAHVHVKTYAKHGTMHRQHPTISACPHGASGAVE